MANRAKTVMSIGVIRAQTNFTFHWPEGAEEYSPIIELRVLGFNYAKPLKLYIAYGYRKVFGAVRRRILVFRNEADVLAEFVGVDSWAQDKRVVTFLRRDGSKKYLRMGDSVPSRYTQFNVVHSKSIITGPYTPQCLAVVLDEADLSLLAAVAIAREQGEAPDMAETIPIVKPTTVDAINPSVASHDRSRDAIQALLDYRSKQETGGSFTGGNKEADEFLRRNPFAFLTAASIDRGALAEAVWEIPFLLNKKLGHLDPQLLSQMSIAQLEEVLRSLGRRPRFPRQSAQTITSLSRLVLNQFHGNAANIWEDKQPSTVVQTLEQIWGVGPGIAHMIVRILVDEFGYDPGSEGLRQIDIKPDTHIIRVFCRTGLTRNRSGKACVEAARQLYPEFPGLLDWPAWEIGRTWCHEHNPECMECPLYNVCLRTDIQVKERQIYPQTSLMFAPTANRLFIDLAKLFKLYFCLRGVAQRLARMVWDHEVGGSNPLTPTNFT